MVFLAIIKSIISGEAENTMALTKQALAQGFSAESVLEKGLIAGMDRVAEKFREQRVMVPEVLMASRAMHAGLSLVEPLLKDSDKKIAAKIVMGTVAGDLHDIGLSLVKMLVISTGAEIINLGVDVTPKKFASVVRKEKPHILMMSALLTTTMTVMKEVIDELELMGIRKNLVIIVGGAPVDSGYAKTIGADYYFEDAFEVRVFLEENLAKIISRKSR
ncbi:corrinoid protein [Desulfosporosinus sp. BICA1-9]|uniref:corrinoid protein n=1 Tax=Desulfosporosinus sp. BICA1-9 TaxID=1531958 RepID=UPI00054B527D|nr:corrinoid protein [Desulfosporosinus sp. BICA1-9]KJS46627.1 MAG: cobalamin-binding protein [Peptococcaceae bacterium BRH_c23]KJS80337.1 MAG: cobalamin-binding protein [Desulfosporosinus sp. BICA1-9]HBW39108.1 cobalamin-binding protein [Desulfosporosinus sp.]